MYKMLKIIYIVIKYCNRHVIYLYNSCIIQSNNLRSYFMKSDLNNHKCEGNVFRLCMLE